MRNSPHGGAMNYLSDLYARSQQSSSAVANKRFDELES